MASAACIFGLIYLKYNTINEIRKIGAAAKVIMITVIVREMVREISKPTKHHARTINVYSITKPHLYAPNDRPASSLGAALGAIGGGGIAEYV